MTDDTIHTCSYYCERPECIKRQRDELRDRMESVLASAPPSAPVGVDFAAVASILRRAMRDGTHYGYRREFILQQALALEALAQQPAAVDGPDAQVAEIEALRAEVERLRRLVQERDTMLGKRLCSGTNADGKPRCIVLAEERARAERLAEALREWWSAHRPVGWTEDQHRARPYVNLITVADKALTEALLRDQEARND